MRGTATHLPNASSTAALRTPVYQRPGFFAGVVTTLLVVAQLFLDRGCLREDISLLQAGDAWRSGGWLSQTLLYLVKGLPGPVIQEAVLSVLASVLLGIGLELLYRRLRAALWSPIGGLMVVATVLLHAATVFVLTADAGYIPTVLALAALVPAIWSMETVGDVQSAIGFGLWLPLLLLAGPLTALLILPLTLAAALANGDARRHSWAFLAMLLVTILPSVIVAIGIWVFLARASFSFADMLRPYVSAYSSVGSGDLAGSLAALLLFAPVMALPVAFIFWPSRAGNRHPVGALAVVAIPLYLAVARVVLNTSVSPILPPLTLVVMFVTWLALQRLSQVLRVAAVLLLAASAILSWTATGLWDNSAWKSALVIAVQGISRPLAHV